MWQCPYSPRHSQDPHSSGGAERNRRTDLLKTSKTSWWFAVRDGVGSPAKVGHNEITNCIVLVLALSDSVRSIHHTYIRTYK